MLNFYIAGVLWVEIVIYVQFLLYTSWCIIVLEKKSLGLAQTNLASVD